VRATASARSQSRTTSLAAVDRLLQRYPPKTPINGLSRLLKPVSNSPCLGARTLPPPMFRSPVARRARRRFASPDNCGTRLGRPSPPGDDASSGPSEIKTV
jgi:hypothetical protein